MTNEELRECKFTILAHNGGGADGGWDDALTDYLNKEIKISKLVKIDFPFGKYTKRKSAKIKTFSNGHIQFEKYSWLRFPKEGVFSYSLDFVLATWYGLKYCRGSKLCVGMDPLLTLPLLLLKKIGFIDKVAYCMVDYTPRRFNAGVLNWLYYFIDRTCCYKSDWVFPLNKAMIEGRIEDMKYAKHKINWVEVPFGNNSNRYTKSDHTHHKNNIIVYLGGIYKNKGAELFVPIVQEILKSGFLEIKLICIGGGETSQLLDQVQENMLEKYISVLGPVERDREVENILLSASVAIAPYYPHDTNNFSYYSDPGKVKLYLGCGLPVVITDVPRIAKVIENSGAGKVSKYDPKDYAQNVMTVLNDINKYRKCAIELGKSYSWTKIFQNTFSTICK